jgi:hypothetical protein
VSKSSKKFEKKLGTLRLLDPNHDGKSSSHEDISYFTSYSVDNSSMTRRIAAIARKLPNPNLDAE